MERGGAGEANYLKVPAQRIKKKGCPAFCISMPNRKILFCALQGKEVCFYDGKAAGGTGSERELKIFTKMVCG